MDSNKRVALAACHVFLLINDYQIEAEPDLFYQHEKNTTDVDTHSEEDIRKEVRSSDKIFERNEVSESKNDNKNTEKEVVIYKERPVKTIDKLLIFYNDNTYEAFIPEKHSTE